MPSRRVPLIKAKNQLNCFALSFVYSSNGTSYDRTLQAYWDLQMTGMHGQVGIKEALSANACLL